MKEFWHKDGTRSVIASLISILIGLGAGSLLIFIVGLSTPSLGLKSAWEGIRLVFAGVFSTGRDTVGNLTFGFNPSSMGNMLFRAMPLILTAFPWRWHLRRDCLTSARRDSTWRVPRPRCLLP